MVLRTYRAYTMAEALAAVKRDLGARATILSTRSFKRGRFFGLWRQTVVEVTVSTGDEATVRVASERAAGSARRANPAPSQAAARQAYLHERAAPRIREEAQSRDRVGGRAGRMNPGRPISNLEARKLDLLAAIEEHRRQSQPPAVHRDPVDPSPDAYRPRAVPVEKPARVPASEIPGSPSPAVSPTGAMSTGDAIIEPKPGADVEAAAPVAPVAQRFILQPATSASAREPMARQGVDAPARVGAAEMNRSAPASWLSPSVSAVPGADAVQSELHAIHQMVGRILQQQALGATTPGGAKAAGRPAIPMPQHVFDTYLQLVGQDLSEELASEVIEQVQGELSPDELADPGTVRAAARNRLVALVPTAEEPLTLPTSDGRPRTIALIGPTGVGKTTTLAKLAATFKLRQGRRVGLITSDTYRIAAVEQLRTYATIIGLPLQVVLSPDEMSQACHQLRDCDVILIDTAGRSQKDHERLDELASFIAAADPHEVHLVLSSTAGEKVLMQEAESFSRIRIDRIILTKLDEAVSFGMLINVVRKVGRELSFLTTGQEVPDHIEPGRPERLAGLLLGEEVRA